MEVLAKVNRDDGSYASGDLYRRENNKDGSLRGYVYVGRADDTLVHMNGEKTNPVPMEQSIKSSPLVRDCLVFGRDSLAREASSFLTRMPGCHMRTCPNKKGKPHSRSRSSLCCATSMVRPHTLTSCTRDDSLPPSHAKFPVADKGSIKRAPANQLYANDIAQLYTEFDLGTSTPDEAKATIESKEQLEPLLQDILERYLDLKLDDKKDADLTGLGVDSVMDSQIRSQIHRSVRMPTPLPGTIVFQHPTLHRLTDAVYTISRLELRMVPLLQTVARPSVSERPYEIRKQLSSQLRRRDPSLVEKALLGEKEVVVLTRCYWFAWRSHRRPTATQVKRCKGYLPQPCI